jgi:hypothetical protein
VPVGDARDREQTVLRYDTSHMQICRSALNRGRDPRMLLARVGVVRSAHRAPVAYGRNAGLVRR